MSFNLAQMMYEVLYKDSLFHSDLTKGMSATGLFNSPCQRQCELLPSLGVSRSLTFHILIFSSDRAEILLIWC
jgi:hypothetical protein